MKILHILLLALYSATFLAPAAVAAQPKSFDDLDRLGIRPSPVENPCVNSICTFNVRGTISFQTVKEAQSFFLTHGEKTLVANFDSLGGDVRAAIELGRLIRKHLVTTQLLVGDCASACVLAFVGGVNRTAPVKQPKFGIHSPYSADTKEATYKDADGRFKATAALSIQYLRDMNIPISLYEEMLRYPAESMHLMTRDELSRHRVLGMDPAEQDRRDSNMARYYGVDKQTYLSRKQLAKIECDQYLVESPTRDTILKYVVCEERIMLMK